MSKVASLIGTGVALGAVHVLTGPDHLSALATLSANVRSVLQAFCLGVRWGLGHSTGLLIVGIVFILLSRTSDQDTVSVPDRLSHFFESLVGVFMILLGLYGMRRALQKRPKVGTGTYSYLYSVIPTIPHPIASQSQTIPITIPHQHDHPYSHPHPYSDHSRGHDTQNNPNGHSYHTHTYLQLVTITDADADGKEEVNEVEALSDDAGDAVPDADEDGKEVDDAEALSDDAGDSNSTATVPSSRRFGILRTCCTTIATKISTRTMAVLAGIIHGLAGPGGVLGVIPAVQLHDSRLAAIYLGSFCISSTLTMGVFAIVYGKFTSRLVYGAEPLVATSAAANIRTSRLEFRIECVSSSLSIVVGLLWLILLSIGKLDDVFP